MWSNSFRKQIVLFGFLLSSISLQSQTVNDIDGNTYKTVKIGTQVWMAENLKVLRFSNGELLPEITKKSVWKNTESPSFCYYSNDRLNKNKYGLLYNHYVIENGRNICPIGWHVSNHNDWEMLFSELGCFGLNCPTLISTLNLLPGGWRDYEGKFGSIKDAAFLWEYGYSQPNDNKKLYMITFPDGSKMKLGSMINSGLSIRCVKD